MADLATVVKQLKENNDTMYTMADFQMEVAAGMENLQETVQNWFNLDKAHKLNTKEISSKAELRANEVNILADSIKDIDVLEKNEQPSSDNTELSKQLFDQLIDSNSENTLKLLAVQEQISDTMKSVAIMFDEWFRKDEANKLQMLEAQRESKIRVPEQEPIEKNNNDKITNEDLSAFEVFGLISAFRIMRKNLLAAGTAIYGAIIGFTGLEGYLLPKGLKETIAKITPKAVQGFFANVGKVLRPIAGLFAIWDGMVIGLKNWKENTGVDAVIKGYYGFVGGFLGSFFGEMANLLKSIPIYLIKKLFPSMIGEDGKFKTDSFMGEILGKIDEMNFNKIIVDMFDGLGDVMIKVKDYFAEKIRDVKKSINNFTGMDIFDIEITPEELKAKAKIIKKEREDIKQNIEKIKADPNKRQIVKNRMVRREQNKLEALKQEAQKLNDAEKELMNKNGKSNAVVVDNSKRMNQNNSNMIINGGMSPVNNESGINHMN